MSNATDPPVLRAHGLPKQYGEGDVDGADLDLGARETVAAARRGGCGRSTPPHPPGGLNRPSGREGDRGLISARGVIGRLGGLAGLEG